jgi:hypothetical protein
LLAALDEALISYQAPGLKIHVHWSLGCPHLWHGPSRHACRFGSGLSLCNGWMLSGRSWCFWGIEKLRIVPGFTQANSLDLYYMPYTHGLPGSVLLSLVFGVIVALFTSGNRVTTILLVAAASFSHWVLDLVVHVHDLPLYDNAAKIGFGLWRHVVLSFPLELIVPGLGAWLYARAMTFASAKGRCVFWAFVFFLALLQVYANFGPPPSSPEAMAAIALAFCWLCWPLGSSQ